MVTLGPLIWICTVLTMVRAEGMEIYKKKDLAVTACSELVLDTALYWDEDLDPLGYCDVNNQQGMGTMAHCIAQIPHPHALEALLESCASYNLTREQFQDSYDNATQYLTNVTADPNFNATAMYYRPALLERVLIDDGYQSAIGRYYNENIASWYGIALMSYWFFLVFASGVFRLIYFVFPGFVKSLNGTFSNKVRKYITLPATGKRDHAQHKTVFKVFQWALPTRWETIMVSGWYLMALIFNAVHYKHNPNNLFWPTSKTSEMGRKLADRTGIMSLYLIPTLILFAGRNNFVLWFTGWTYSRFVFIHRWVARFAVLLVILHAVGMTLNAKPLGNYDRRNGQDYVRWGYVALIAGCLMVAQSLFVLRKVRYEFFLLCHILFAVFFIAGGWIHTADQGYQHWFYAATAVWCFDRFMRLARLAAFGVHTAQVELKANEALRVTVPRPAYWKPFPGCYAFIHFIRPSCFWQSHPFTIVDSVTSKNTITFYIKVKGGVTHGLYKYLAKQPGATANIKVTVEGPYGQRTPIGRYENAVFITGGNGIPGLYAEVYDCALKEKSNQRLKLYWTIRHYKSLEWFRTELMKLKDTNVETVVYVTQPNSNFGGSVTDKQPRNTSEEDDTIEEKKDEDHEDSVSYVGALKSELSHIEFREVRPNIEELISNEVAEANGPIAFATCAHPSMVDDARKGVVDNLDKSKYRVELFEEIQNW